MPRSNQLKEPVIHLETPQHEEKKMRKSRFGRALQDVLGGNFLSSSTFTLLPFLFYIAFLAFIYIANNYLAENKIREINKLRKEVKELRFEYINDKSELTQLEKQSQLSRQLEQRGIKQNTEPLKTIIIKNDD